MCMLQPVGQDHVYFCIALLSARCHHALYNIYDLLLLLTLIAHRGNQQLMPCRSLTAKYNAMSFLDTASQSITVSLKAAGAATMAIVP